MKTLLGIVLGASLAFAGTAFAATTPAGLKFISSVVSDEGNSSVEKYEDTATSIVCYVAPHTGIFCIKNLPIPQGQG